MAKIRFINITQEKYNQLKKTNKLDDNSLYFVTLNNEVQIYKGKKAINTSKIYIY